MHVQDTCGGRSAPVPLGTNDVVRGGAEGGGSGGGRRDAVGNGGGGDGDVTDDRTWSSSIAG